VVRAHSSTPPGCFTVIAAIGPTITPWGQFFIQAYVVDKHISVKGVRLLQKRRCSWARCSPTDNRLLHRHRLRRHPVQPRHRGKHGARTRPGRSAPWQARPPACSSARLLNVSILGLHPAAGDRVCVLRGLRLRGPAWTVRSLRRRRSTACWGCSSSCRRWWW